MLKPIDRVFSDHRAFVLNDPKSNTLVFEGCKDIEYNSATTGDFNVRLQEFLSPSAAIDTGDFEFELYRSFDSTNFILTDLLVTGKKSIPKDVFIGGELTQSSFQSSMPYI